ncbi:hypothetical protein scyTo_0023304, partial [Scyliorhinus torazame]|nr:hypothetical protein [Scyliorhinus torazame]
VPKVQVVNLSIQANSEDFASRLIDQTQELQENPGQQNKFIPISDTRDVRVHDGSAQRDATLEAGSYRGPCAVQHQEPVTASSSVSAQAERGNGNAGFLGAPEQMLCLAEEARSPIQAHPAEARASSFQTEGNSLGEMEAVAEESSGKGSFQQLVNERSAGGESWEDGTNYWDDTKLRLGSVREETPVQQASWEEEPAEQASWEETPVQQASWEETPARQASWEETPVQQASWEETPVQQASWEETPVQQASSPVDVVAPGVSELEGSARLYLVTSLHVVGTYQKEPGVEGGQGPTLPPAVEQPLSAGPCQVMSNKGPCRRGWEGQEVSPALCEMDGAQRLFNLRATSPGREIQEDSSRLTLLETELPGLRENPAAGGGTATAPSKDGQGDVLGTEGGTDKAWQTLPSLSVSGAQMRLEGTYTNVKESVTVPENLPPVLVPSDEPDLEALAALMEVARMAFRFLQLLVILVMVFSDSSSVLWCTLYLISVFLL